MSSLITDCTRGRLLNIAEATLATRRGMDGTSAIRTGVASPIELVVFGFKCTSKDANGEWTDIKTVHTVLQAMAPILAEKDVDMRKLQVTMSTPDSAYQRTIRIGWHGSQWYRNVDLVADMGSVMEELWKRGVEAFWANASESDCRNRARFTRRLKTDIGSPMGDSDYPPLAEPAPTTWLLTRCPQAHADVACHTVLETTVSASGVSCETVEVEFFHPSSVDLIESLFAEDRLDHQILGNPVSDFHRVATQITTSYPTTIVSPDRLGYEPEDLAELLSELDGWIAGYNEDSGTNNTLLETEGARGRLVYDAHFVVVPSSIGLAEFLCKQTPRHGYPYELLYDLNGRDLVPAALAPVIAQEEERALKRQVAGAQMEAAAAQKEAAQAEKAAAQAKKAAAQAKKAAADAELGAALLDVEEMHDSATILAQLQMLLEGQAMVQDSQVALECKMEVLQAESREQRRIHRPTSATSSTGWEEYGGDEYDDDPSCAGLEENEYVENEDYYLYE